MEDKKLIELMANIETALFEYFKHIDDFGTIRAKVTFTMNKENGVFTRNNLSIEWDADNTYHFPFPVDTKK